MTQEATEFHDQAIYTLLEKPEFFPGVTKRFLVFFLCSTLTKVPKKHATTDFDKGARFRYRVIESA